MKYDFQTHADCNEVDRYGKKEAGTGEHLRHFNKKIQMKSGSPSRTTAAHKTQTKIQAWSSLVFHCHHSSFNPSEAPPWDSRPVVQVSFIYSTGLAPFPWLWARPTRHIPPSPFAGRGVLPRLRSTPPLPPLPGGARQGGRGVPGGKDRQGERKGDGRIRSDREERGERGKKISVRFPDTLPLGPQPAERLTRGAMRWYWTSLVDGPMLLRLLADGDGSSGRGQAAASPPFPAPPQTWRMAAGFGLQANGADSSAPSRPRSTAASLLSHLFFFCSSTTASGSHWRSPLLPAARSPQHRDPPQQRGLSDSVSLLPPGFRHQCNEVDRYGKKEAGTGEHSGEDTLITK